MSIFGKKTSGFGFADGVEPPRLRKDDHYPSEKITVPPTTPPVQAPIQPPLVQKAVPLQNHTQIQTQAPMSPAPKEGNDVSKSPYSIEDVIRLMRELPDSKKEMVVIIVQKTLLSAKIDIHSIIEDAGRKVDKLQRSNDKMVSEIRELEEAIIQKKGEVDRLSRDIEETNGVKQVFELVYGRHVKAEMDAPLPEKTVPPSVPNSKFF